MPLSFNDLIEIGNDAVPFRAIYDAFGLDYIRSEGNTQCRCPFHGEDRHPSARIYEDTNSWYCFTCGFAKTPIFFFKAMMERSLTDAVAEYFRVFRNEILQSYPELAGEKFTPEDVRLAYLRHLGEDSGFGINAQQRMTGIVLTQRADLALPQATMGMQPAAFYQATREVWRRYYMHPYFFALYLEFVRHLNRISLPTVTQEDYTQLNNFLMNLQRNFKTYAEAV